MNHPHPTRRSFFREPFCGFSHLTGAVLSAIGLIWLLVMAHGHPTHTVAFAIYGVSLVFLYTSSALYHLLHASEDQLDRMQKMDHIAIYLLIIGTYTPVCLIALRGAWGWGLLGVVGGLGLLGIAISLFWKRPPDWIRVVLYVCMGWSSIAALGPLGHVLPPAAIAWLVAGGLVYTIGTVIFALDKPHLWPGKFSAHDLWHLFVLGGSACHFVLMSRYVAPLAAVAG